MHTVILERILHLHPGQGPLLILALFFALAAGLIGCFALMKRMLLAGDVISHLALPGLGIAFLFKINPLVGGAATLFLVTHEESLARRCERIVRLKDGRIVADELAA